MSNGKSKKIVFGLITVVMLLLLSSVCFVSFAADESGSCGSGLTWTYNDASKTLTISGNGAMNDFASHSDAPWVNHNWEITKIIFENGITKSEIVLFNIAPRSQRLRFRILLKQSEVMPSMDVPVWFQQNSGPD